MKHKAVSLRRRTRRKLRILKRDAPIIDNDQEGVAIPPLFWLDN